MIPAGGSNVTSPLSSNVTGGNVTSPLQDNISKTLSLSISVAKDPIIRGNIQTITVKVSDANSKERIQGANVNVEVKYPTGTTKQFSGSTDSLGSVSFSWRISGDAVTGKFTVTAQASKDGYRSAHGTTSFNVIPASILSLSIFVSKNPIVCGNVQTITVTVFNKDSLKPISGANVKVVTGFPTQFSGSTDSLGRISFPWRISGDAVTGKFTVTAQASKDGYSPASGSASFLS